METPSQRSSWSLVARIGGFRWFSVVHVSKNCDRDRECIPMDGRTDDTAVEYKCRVRPVTD